MQTRLLSAALLTLSLAIAACSDPSSPQDSATPSLEPTYGKTPAPTNPTATVGIPLAGSALALRSDGAFSSGLNSLYSHGVCGVTATIFVTGSSSGDMVMVTGNPRFADRRCVSYPRRVTVVYPDNTSEVIAPVDLIVHQLQTTTFTIPVGTTALRHFNVRTSSARCEGVHWGGTTGGDSVQVTRVSANSWHVTTQPSPNNRAACRATSGNTVLGEMNVDFWITSSTNLP